MNQAVPSSIPAGVAPYQTFQGQQTSPPDAFTSSLADMGNGGVSGQDMTAAFAQRAPATIGDFYNQGGLQNTISQAAQQVQAANQKKAAFATFQKLLMMQENGANLIKQAAETQYPGIIMPDLTTYYDDKTGAFMPYQYAKDAHATIDDFMTRKEKQDKIDQVKQKESLTMAGRQQLQDFGSKFNGTSSDFAQKARQLPAYAQGALDDKTIDDYAKSYTKPLSPREEITKRNSELAGQLLDLRRKQFSLATEKQDKDQIQFTISEWKNEKENAIKEYHSLDAALKKKDAFGNKEITDPAEIADAKMRMDEYDHQVKLLDDNIKMGFTKLQEPGTKSIFSPGSNVPSSVVPDNSAPGAGDATAAPAAQATDPDTIYRGKAVEILNNSGKSNPTEAQIQFIMGKIKEKHAQSNQ